MSEKKTYTAEEQAAYWKKRAQAKQGTQRKRAASTTGRRRGRKSTKGAPAGGYKKRSGVIMSDSYKAADGSTVNAPHIFAWRVPRKGPKQTVNCYLDKNNGKPRNGTSTDVCRVFVCNIVNEGHSTSTETGVWSEQYGKLSITKLGLVINPGAPNGGYFGPGGSKYKDKVK